MLAEAVRPVDVGVEAEGVGRVDEAEEIHAACSRALEVEAAVELVLAANRLIEPRLHHVLMAVAERGRLVIVKRIASDVGGGIEPEKCLSLRADRYLVVCVGHAG